jgi:acetyl-CoA synthetase
VLKAYVMLTAGYEPSRDTALSILRYARENLAPYRRIRQLESPSCPRRSPAKVRRVELRGRENDLHSATNAVIDSEWHDEDFPELRG